MKKTPTPVVWPFPSRAEAAFAEDVRKLFRAAGESATWRLADRMVDASDDGADQGDLHAMLAEALAALSPRH